jgi:FtsH-binding integral membrane protein
VCFEAVVFAPLLSYAQSIAGGELMLTAAVMALTLFGGLTLAVIFTKSDFSFLKGILTVFGSVGLGLIVCGALFGFELGTWFSAGMIGFASATILYSTSKVLNELTEEQYVGASLELFAAMGLLFWYVVRFVITFWSND